jgi:hypothetical protein
MIYKLTERRTLTLFLVSAFVFSSCHKNSGSSDGGNPVNNSYMASAQFYTSGTLSVDSLIYDANHNVTQFFQYQTDGSHKDTTIATFTYSGSGSLPTGYNLTYTAGVPDPHQLTFDGQGRITRDTSLNGYGFVTYYTYPGNYIIIRTLDFGSTSSETIDSLVVSNGNVTGELLWVTDNTGTLVQNGNITIGHATVANPAYKAQIAGSIGPLLHMMDNYNYGAYTDYISKAMINKVSGIADGASITIDYTISVDASGRVSSWTPVSASLPSGAGDKTTFTYY